MARGVRALQLYLREIVVERPLGRKPLVITRHVRQANSSQGILEKHEDAGDSVFHYRVYW